RKGRPKTRPVRVIADKGYDSDPLRKRLKKRGITLLSPYRKNRKNKRKQDHRMKDRYARRYKVERTFAWLGSFRRLVVRYEHNVSVYTGFFHIACFLITMRWL
ncbi:MAG: transposase, partial [Desulfomonilaceae bacterium]